MPDLPAAASYLRIFCVRFSARSAENRTLKEIKYRLRLSYNLAKIIPTAYLTHVNWRATLWLDICLSVRRAMMTTAAHNLIGSADTLEAALF
jgi:hypothetical protein